MARWECVKLYYYHYEDPENSFGFFGARGPNGCYERQEVRDLARTLSQLEVEGWKIEKVSQPASLTGLERLAPGQRQEIFQLTRRIE